MVLNNTTTKKLLKSADFCGIGFKNKVKCFLMKHSMVRMLIMLV